MKLRCEICKEPLEKCDECGFSFDKEDTLYCVVCGDDCIMHFCSLSCLTCSKIVIIGEAELEGGANE